MKNIIKPPTKEEAKKIMNDKFDEVFETTQGQNLINELYLCKIFDLKYVDVDGYDGIDKKTGEKIELKSTDARSCGRASWGSCGLNKKLADFFIFWVKITGQWAKVSNLQVQETVDSSGGIKARLSDNPGGRSKKIKTASSWFN